MRIGFLAPMKAPDHPVPSGDRTMARHLVDALGRAGHAPVLLTRLSTFLAAPDPAAEARVEAAARAEVARLAAAWEADPDGRPEAVLAYPLFYKAPDLVGAPLAARFGLPYLTAEASYAGKRDDGPWRIRQAAVAAAVRAAAVNLCFTANDRAGLAGLAAETLVDFPPFIDAAPYEPRRGERTPGAPRLVTLAMMRPGDKARSYAFLAEALAGVPAPWTLAVIGDGPARAAIEPLFSARFSGRVAFSGALDAPAVAAALRGADLMVWPGFNEAFGLCYLEAQACGLPVVALRGEGTVSVVLPGRTGLLTAPDPAAYAGAVAGLLADPERRAAMGAAARAFVAEERDMPGAAARLDAALALARRNHRKARHAR